MLPLAAAGQSADTLLACRRIESASERVACYDRVIDATREVAPDATAASAQAAAAESAEVEVDRSEESLRSRWFGRRSEQDRALREAYGAEPPAEITARVASVEMAPDRSYQFSFDDGQVWKQKVADGFYVRVGDRVRIKEGALGAYYAQRENGGKSTGVKRIR